MTAAGDAQEEPAGREVLYGAFAVEGCHLCAVLDPPPHVHAFNRDADGNEVLTAVRTAKPAASGSEEDGMSTPSDQDTGRRATIPDLDRTWELIELAYADDGVTVLGWADDMVVTLGHNVRFDVNEAPERSHEDVVLVVAIRVPHPDAMTFAEVVHGAPAARQEQPDD